MSGAQAPPRIRMGLPFTENTRVPAELRWEVTCRIPKEVDRLSLTRPPLVKVSLSVCRLGVPYVHGHHSTGLARLSCGKLPGENVTAFVCPAARLTSCEK